MRGRRYSDYEKRHVCIAFRDNFREQEVLSYLQSVDVEMRSFSSFYQQFKYMERRRDPIHNEAFSAQLLPPSIPPAVPLSPMPSFAPPSPVPSLASTQVFPLSPLDSLVFELGDELTDGDMSDDDNMSDGDGGETGTCGICQENCLHKSMAMTTCGHGFCTQCALSHMTSIRRIRNRVCPMCRTPLNGTDAFKCV